jgi:hypothetical protein
VLEILLHGDLLNPEVFLCTDVDVDVEVLRKVDELCVREECGVEDHLVLLALNIAVMVQVDSQIILKDKRKLLQDLMIIV